MTFVMKERPFLHKYFLLGIFRQLLGSKAVNKLKFQLRMHNYYSGKVKKFQVDIIVLSGLI